ncbi:hypothetical protein COUCH_25640 [Couchioplanes caeruleus]|uniref:hypothetical protein n=1 Tax=Couchioplanes caeruleus TaxID=56438 RepID=UPI0020C0A6B1|nr:hypothetical protein [Couchioplanes caeruleus]UQU62405.1 hypothetical protein COUCH_25640 [Couchioplanes caeruleus]
MNVARTPRSGPLLLAAALLGAVVSPGVALADGPGYGGTADALTVQWQQPADAGGDGLAVYAVGFRGGSPVNLRVGAAAERSVIADASGALRVLVVAGATPAPAPTVDTTVLPVGAGSAARLSTGTSVLAVGKTPTGALRTLVGSVPPPTTGRGVQDLAPWAGAAAAVAGAALWLRRRNAAAAAGVVQRYRHPARHRA